MTLSKLCRATAIVTLLLAASVLSAVAVKADDDRDTFLENPGDTWHIDRDDPDQDPKYDTDDPKYDEMDDLDHDSDDRDERDSGYSRQSYIPPSHRQEKLWI